MSDQELRALEREILQAPAALDLRRRHARALQRTSDEERALAALDLAWRLGADELLDEVRARCAARQVVVRGVTLCYVPGGPFAMGADDQDDDAAPLHVVHLSPFYVAREPLAWGSLEGWRDRWPLNDRTPYRATALQEPALYLTHQEAEDAVAYLGVQAASEGAPPGRWSLISEAQWERLARAALVTPDGRSPYGVAPSTRLEWTADVYDPGVYGGARRDPRVDASPARDQLVVVRGVPTLPPPVRATYREASTRDGRFEVEGKPRSSWWRGRTPGTRGARHQGGVEVRPVLVPRP